MLVLGCYATNTMLDANATHFGKAVVRPKSEQILSLTCVIVNVLVSPEFRLGQSLSGSGA